MHPPNELPIKARRNAHGAYNPADVRLKPAHLDGELVSDCAFSVAILSAPEQVALGAKRATNAKKPPHPGHEWHRAGGKTAEAAARRQASNQRIKAERSRLRAGAPGL